MLLHGDWFVAPSTAKITYSTSSDPYPDESNVLSSIYYILASYPVYLLTCLSFWHFICAFSGALSGIFWHPFWSFSAAVQLAETARLFDLGFSSTAVPGSERFECTHCHPSDLSALLLEIQESASRKLKVHTFTKAYPGSIRPALWLRIAGAWAKAGAILGWNWDSTTEQINYCIENGLLTQPVRQPVVKFSNEAAGLGEILFLPFGWVKNPCKLTDELRNMSSFRLNVDLQQPHTWVPTTAKFHCKKYLTSDCFPYERWQTKSQTKTKTFACIYSSATIQPI